MAEIYLSNTLSRKKEKFAPVKTGTVGIYSCGPTVYWNQHIGHMYAYVQWDILVRFLRHVGYQVTWVMNITDVGHLTSDEDTGIDKMEKGAEREGVTVWNLADKYIRQFSDSLQLLNITFPDKLPRATDHIPDQIRLIEQIQKNGFGYQTEMGVVFDTSKFPQYADFARLDLKKQQARADVIEDRQKKNPWDFLLWVTGNPKHIMQWDSPWGKGYPGWHIECTAMSTKYLGNRFDIHTGGVEHIPVHHTNEIAQGYGAFGHPTANFWLHNSWLTGKGGEKMSKSLGNFITAQELAEKGYNPLALRYLILSSHYKTGLQFSYTALDAATVALNKLRNIVSGLRENKQQQDTLSPEKLQQVEKLKTKFTSALADDLNTPVALAVLWEMLKSSLTAQDKYELALSFDEVLGFKLAEITEIKPEVPDNIRKLLNLREELRKAGKFAAADELRKKIEAQGFQIKDTAAGIQIGPGKKID